MAYNDDRPRNGYGAPDEEEERLNLQRRAQLQQFNGQPNADALAQAIAPKPRATAAHDPSVGTGAAATDLRGALALYAGDESASQGVNHSGSWQREAPRTEPAARSGSLTSVMNAPAWGSPRPGDAAIRARLQTGLTRYTSGDVLPGGPGSAQAATRAQARPMAMAGAPQQDTRPFAQARGATPMTTEDEGAARDAADQRRLWMFDSRVQQARGQTPQGWDDYARSNGYDPGDGIAGAMGRSTGDAGPGAAPQGDPMLELFGGTPPEAVDLAGALGLYANQASGVPPLAQAVAGINGGLERYAGGKRRGSDLTDALRAWFEGQQAHTRQPR